MTDQAKAHEALVDRCEDALRREGVFSPPLRVFVIDTIIAEVGRAAMEWPTEEMMTALLLDSGKWPSSVKGYARRFPAVQGAAEVR